MKSEEAEKSQKSVCVLHGARGPLVSAMSEDFHAPGAPSPTARCDEVLHLSSGCLVPLNVSSLRSL